MIITEYLKLQKQFQEKYGEKTVLLYQIGSFYEIYGYDPTCCTSDAARKDKDGIVWNEAIGLAQEMSIVLNSALSRENKNEPYSILNCYKVGFPMIAYEKNRATLLANDYAIVRMDQEDTPTSGKKNRKIAEICSPDLELDAISSLSSTNNIVAIYVEYLSGANTQASSEKYSNYLITTGVAVVDIITGQNRICEFYSKPDDQIFALQEIHRFLLGHSPKVVLLYVDDFPGDASKYTEFVSKTLESHRYERFITHTNNVNKEYKNPAYQTEFFNKLFAPPQKQIGLLNIISEKNNNIIETLGLERMNYGRISYMLLLQYCYSHNNEIVGKLSKPDLQWLDEDRHLILTHNAISQLEVLNTRSNKKTDSLMNVLDETHTLLGKRLLANLLQNPMLKATDIQVYYDIVGELSEKNKENIEYYKILARALKELPDIGRYQRKLAIKIISPKEVAVLYHAYIKIIELYVTILQSPLPTLHKNLLSTEDITSFNAYISRYAGIFDFQRLECCYTASSESGSTYFEFVDVPIRPGVYPDIDRDNMELLAAENQLNLIVDHLNTFLVKSKGEKISYKNAKKKVGAKKQDPTSIILSTTNAKAKLLTEAPVDTTLCGKLVSRTLTANEKTIGSDIIDGLIHVINSSRNNLRRKLYVLYVDILTEMNNYGFFDNLAMMIAKIDVWHSYSKVSQLYKYYKPTLINADGGSYFEIDELRHPIVERIEQNYVTNDVALGNADGCKRTDGILLFGLNQVGKSTLAKALALNIIMAQAGCYTAGRLKFVPYKKIITRLNGGDDIHQGKSSFANEMAELRTILRQADHNTLVIGDEIAHTSDTTSAIGITVSATLYLLKRKASFIFATHMHEILNVSYMKQIDQDKLRICHLSVNKDEQTRKVIYNRKLQPGHGDSVYGVIVAESLDLPSEFIETAYEIVNEVMNKNMQIIETKKSKYNTNLYVDSCTICKSNTDLHTHHLLEQKYADEKGFIGSMHKNSIDNLVVLCNKCHTELHQQKKEIVSISTGTGKLLTLKESIV